MQQNIIIILKTNTISDNISFKYCLLLFKYCCFKFIFLQSKHKHSKSITKDMSKSELWKEETGWILEFLFYFFIILQLNLKDTFYWHVYIFSRLSPILNHSFFYHLENFVFVLSPGTNNVISFPLLGEGRSVGKQFLFYQLGLQENSFLFSGPVRWKNHLSLTGRAGSLYYYCRVLIFFIMYIFFITYDTFN